MELPTAPYVGIYGSQSGDWQDAVKAALDAAGLAWYDPTDEGWAGIDASNGDARQAEIDALVAREHRGLNGAACVVFHLARREVRRLVPTGKTSASLTSRCEIGYLSGRGIRTFVHIEADVEGRNYLWAQIALYPRWMTRAATLDEATAGAIAFMVARTPASPV
jgi:hypothetical protein